MTVRPIRLLCVTLTLIAPAAVLAVEPIDSPSPVDTVTADDIRQLPSRWSIEDTLRSAPVVVTATRNEQPTFDLPFAADSVGSNQIRQRQYRNTPQALRDLPGVLIQETSPSQGSPFMRGFTGRQNVFLIDGIRLNNSTNRGGPMQYWNTVDPFSIDRLEIVKGPGSVMYGSDAIGGVVNAITISPNTYQPDGVGFGGRAYVRAASAETSIIGRGDLSVTFDESIGFIGGGTGKHFGDIHGGHDIGRQPNTGFDEYDTDFKIEYFLNPDTRIVAAHQRVRQNNAARTHRTPEAKSYHGTTAGSDRRLDYDEERELSYIQLHALNIDDSFINAAHLSLSWQVAGEVEDRIRSSGARSLRGFDVGTLGLFAQLESETRIGYLTYGFDFYHDNVNSFDTTNPIQGSVADDATYDLFGLFLQNQIPVTDRLDILLGGRFTYAAADADSVQDPAPGGGQIALSDDWTNLSGSARAIYQIVPDHLNVYGGVSQAFRAPNIEDLTSLNIARSGEQAIPSPGLDPENYISYEVGFKARNDRASAEIAYFYTDMDGMIVGHRTGDVSAGGDPIVAKSNSSTGYVNGIEFQSTVEVFDNVFLFGNLTWQEGEIDDEYLSRVMPLSGQIGVRAQTGDRRFWGEAQLVMADKADKLSTGDKGDTQRIPPGGTPGYAVLNLRAGWRVTDNFDLTVGVENITNADYRVHGSGTNMPGTNVIVGGEFRF